MMGRYGKSLKIITICSGLSMILNDIVSDLKAISRFHMLSMHPPAELAQLSPSYFDGRSVSSIHLSWIALDQLLKKVVEKPNSIYMLYTFT